MSEPWIHEVGDGRGQRRVTLDGVEMKFVVYADERKGIAVYHDDPPQIDRTGECFIERTANGKVEVTPWQQ